MNSVYANHISGLYFAGSYVDTRIYLPQVKLESHTTINPVCFTTKLKQTFRNPNRESINQARYTFPLYDGVAVNGYMISYNGKVLKGVVKQKDKAGETYKAAIDRGEVAGLLESLPVGVFGVTVGNVPAEQDVVVEITYCGELKHDSAIDGLRYTLPTSIAPRYGSYPGLMFHGNNVTSGGISIIVDVNMASSAIRKIQSPTHPIAVSLGATSAADSDRPAGYSPFRASATLSLGLAELSDDFVLQVVIDDISKPQAIIETHPTLPSQHAIMATLVPRFTLESANPEIVFIADQSGSMGGSKNASLVGALGIFLKSLPFGVRFNICAFGSQFQFLWPKSKAYNEENVSTALQFVDSFFAGYGGTEILEPMKAVFQQRLGDLPLEIMLLTDGEVWAESDMFAYINEQIHEKKVDARVFALGIGCDVSHTLVEGVARAGRGFAQFVTENEETDHKIMRMLKAALYAHTKDYQIEVHYRSEMDAEKDSEEMQQDDKEFEVIEKVQECLNLDDGPVIDSGTLTGDEKTQSSSSVTGKVKSFFDTSTAELDKPMRDNETLTNRYAHLPAIETPKLLQAPSEIPSLFPFNRTTVYLLLGPETTQGEVTSITLRASSAEGPLELSIPVHCSQPLSTPTIHQLAARKAVQDLEEGRGWLHNAVIPPTTDLKEIPLKTKYASRFDEIVEREAVILGEKFQVASKWTSFVAIEDGKIATREDETQHEYAEPPFYSRNRRHQSGSGGGVASGGSLMSLRASASPAFASSFSARVSPASSSALRASASPAPVASFFCGRASPVAAPSLFGAQSSQYQPPNSVVRERAPAPVFAPRRQLASMVAQRSTSSPNTLHTLIGLQTFSGAWAWDSGLFAAIGIDETTIASNEIGSDNASVCATALAIAYLETRLTSQKDVWEMVVQKARDWLTAQVGNKSVVDGLVQKATKCLSAASLPMIA